MPDNKENSDNTFEPSFSITNWLRETVNQIMDIIRKNFKLLLVVCLLGGLVGIVYSFVVKVRYQSEITFLVEENRSGGSSGLLSSLGGSLGLDIGSLTGGGSSLLSGDNVLTLLTSRQLMAECLKTPYLNDTNYCLADKYADVYGYRERWKKDPDVGRFVYFAKTDKNTRLQDSLLNIIIKRIEEKEISVTKPDKKLSFFKVALNTKDEALTQLIAERIIAKGTELYINTKVGRIQKNLNRLQNRTDSIGAVLNKKTYQAGADKRMLFNINPAEANAPVFSEISQREKLVLNTIYLELMKNLEVSKTLLIQETPTVQIVDSSVFPLEKIETKWYKAFLIGVGLAFITFISFYYIRLQSE